MSEGVFAAILLIFGTGVMGGLAWVVQTVIRNGARLTEVEAAVKANDVREEVVKVHARVDEMGATVNNVAGQLTQITGLLNLLHEHALKEGRQ